MSIPSIGELFQKRIKDNPDKNVIGTIKDEQIHFIDFKTYFSNVEKTSFSFKKHGMEKGDKADRGQNDSQHLQFLMNHKSHTYSALINSEEGKLHPDLSLTGKTAINMAVQIIMTNKTCRKLLQKVYLDTKACLDCILIPFYFQQAYSCAIRFLRSREGRLSNMRICSGTVLVT